MISIYFTNTKYFQNKSNLYIFLYDLSIKTISMLKIKEFSSIGFMLKNYKKVNEDKSSYIVFFSKYFFYLLKNTST